VIKFNARVRPSSSLMSSSSASREASRQGDRSFFLRSREMKRYDVGPTTGPAQSTPLQPKTAFSRFPRVHKLDLKGPLRVESMPCGSRTSRTRLPHAAREAALSFRARLAQIASRHHRLRSQGNGRCSRSSYVREAVELLADCRSCGRFAPPWCGASSACHTRCCPSRHPRSNRAQCARTGAPSREADCGLGLEIRGGLDLRGAFSTSLPARRGSVP
jgi:hypothetical protein